MGDFRVCIVPEYPVSLMTGGTLVQAQETYEALIKLENGLRPELFNWSERTPLPDLYHFVSIQPHFYPIIDLIGQVPKPYVITLLTGDPSSARAVSIAMIRHFLKVHLLRKKEVKRSLQGAAAVIAITSWAADAILKIFRIDKTRLHIIPHGIHERFFESSPDAWRAKFGMEPFVLCVGAVQPRKNQLLLLKVCNTLQRPVVLLGPVLPGYQEYGRQVAKAMKQNEIFGGRWIQNLQNDHPLLSSAYAACQLVVLLSSSETQPLSVMQGLAARRPVLLLRAPYTYERPFNDLSFVESAEHDAVAAALQRAWESGKPTSLPHDFAWPNVALRLRKVYVAALGDCVQTPR